MKTDGQRRRNLYDPSSKSEYKLSRSKIEAFLECPRCFYFDRKLGIGRPAGLPFTLNSAVDALLKKEFDTHRVAGTSHSLMKKNGIDAIPVHHEKLNDWRHNFTGVQFLHVATNFLIHGAIDDLWINPKKEFIVVDYKATAKNEDIVALDKEWHAGYKRQMEIYQWLLRNNGLNVSDTGYIVYANGKTDRDGLNGRLEFDLTIIPHLGNTVWIEETIQAISACLRASEPPASNENCNYCLYTSSLKKVVNS